MSTDFVALPPFAYNSLAAREIRILIPDASDLENGLSWLLKTVNLDDHNLHFHALSYAWGPQSETFPVACNGRLLQIHHNLYNALPYLARRYEASEARPYWIDAICINQADHKEKVSQIRLMNVVYRQADKVCVWLGLALRPEWQDRIPRAIELFPLLGKEQARYRHSTSRHKFAVARELSHLGRDGWEAIFHLTRNSYFRRTWMMQEVALAKEVVFLCGDHEIDAQLLEKATVDSWNIRDWAIYDLTNGESMRVQAASHDDTVVFNIRYIVQAESNRSTSGSNHQTIRIANLMDNQTCFAPQDRVLGILGMVQEEFGDATEELHSYTSIADLYTRFSTLMFTGSGPAVTDLYWWYYLSMAFNLKRIDRLPSWVPDLHQNDTKAKRQPFESILAIPKNDNSPRQSSSRPCVASKGPRPDEIVLRGKLLDTVVLIYPEVPHFPDDSELGYGDGMTWLTVLAELIRWERKVADAVFHSPATKFVSDHQHITEDAYWRTLLADMTKEVYSNRQLTREIWLQFRELGQRLLVLIPRLEDLKRATGKDPWTLPNWTDNEQDLATMAAFRMIENPVCNFVAALCFTRDHQLFNTEDGRFGFTCTGVQEGDVVCVFNHSPTPHVLRRVEDRDGERRYRFVGDAYVHGLMHEEADGMEVEELDIVLV